MGAGVLGGSLLDPSLATDVLMRALGLSEDYVAPKRGDTRPLVPTLRRRRSTNESTEEPGDNHSLFLTFDDGPLPCTSKILDLLAASGNKATFFVLGRNLVVPKLRDLALRALKEGHDIANHSYDHPDFSTISAKRAEKEIISTCELIKGLIKEAGVEQPRQNRFFRFPFGSEGTGKTYTACQTLLSDLNYQIAWWDLDTHDWQMDWGAFPRSSSTVIESLKQARPSDVVLLHDRDKTAHHLPEMLRVLTFQQLVSIPLSDYTANIVGNPNSASGKQKNL